MKALIFMIVGLLAGLSLIGTGIYYLLKEKGDKESAKIYGTFTAIGAVITIGVVIKSMITGF